MIVFNIPIISPYNTNNYKSILQALKLTILSITHQIDENWFISIGCNDDNMSNWINLNFPNFKDKIQITQVDKKFHDYITPTNDQLGQSYDHILPQHRDKAYKRLISHLNYKGNYNYFFCLDADDIISNNLTNILSKQKEDVIIIKNGYIAILERRLYREHTSINTMCGSTIAYSNQFINNVALKNPDFYFGTHIKHQGNYMEEYAVVYRLHDNNFATNLWNYKNLFSKKSNNLNNIVKNFPCLKRFVCQVL